MILRLAGRVSASERLEHQDDPVMLGDERVHGEGDTLLWNTLQIGASRMELIDRIVEEYDVDRERAAEGADLYLRQLRRRGLIAEY